MGVPIFNANQLTLPQAVGTLPDVNCGLLNWFQQLTFEQITKTTVNFQVVETPTIISFLGVWQPFSPQQLFLKSEGQRAWKWFTCHAEPNAPLVPDDIVIQAGVNYRVMKKLDYKAYGYIEYQLIEDWDGAKAQ